MEVQIIKHAEALMKVIIACREEDEKVRKLKKHIELFDERIQGKRDNEIVFVELSEVFYFEVVDNRTFIFTHGLPQHC